MKQSIEWRERRPRLPQSSGRRTGIIGFDSERAGDSEMFPQEPGQTWLNSPYFWQMKMTLSDYTSYMNPFVSSELFLFSVIRSCAVNTALWLIYIHSCHPSIIPLIAILRWRMDVVNKKVVCSSGMWLVLFMVKCVQWGTCCWRCFSFSTCAHTTQGTMIHLTCSAFTFLCTYRLIYIQARRHMSDMVNHISLEVPLVLMWSYFRTKVKTRQTSQTVRLRYDSFPGAGVWEELTSMHRGKVLMDISLILHVILYCYCKVSSILTLRLLLYNYRWVTN